MKFAEEVNGVRCSEAFEFVQKGQTFRSEHGDPSVERLGFDISQGEPGTLALWVWPGTGETAISLHILLLIHPI